MNLVILLCICERHYWLLTLFIGCFQHNREKIGYYFIGITWPCYYNDNRSISLKFVHNKVVFIEKYARRITESCYSTCYSNEINWNNSRFVSTITIMDRSRLSIYWVIKNPGRLHHALLYSESRVNSKIKSY